ncbi:MAG: hypothetical protein M3R59_09405 [Verrucomicrobiota bacterium]|nr:hypothetical protein [Verrucomicrobiota bacterium]
MEYTDAPTATVATMSCPRCGHTLPAQAQRCDKCDWHRDEHPQSAAGHASDAFAVLLSAVPGLGHIYKGHTVLGLFILLVVTPLALVISLLAATATAGFALGLLPLYWIAVMIHVWAIDDRVGPQHEDEGEQF